MKVCDFIAKRIKKETDTIFGITGGAVVNLFNSLHKAKIKTVTMHHEQSCAMAADAYARVSGKLGVAIATSGPGATNLITGTCCSWFDSVPVLTIAGQVPTSQIKKNKVRQLGFQEIDTVELFKPITKFSKRLVDPVIDLEIAIITAQEGRKGPTFLELCDDTQRDSFETDEFLVEGTPTYKRSDKICKMIENSEKPVLIIGAGARNNCDQTALRHMIDALGIPVFLTWGAMDLLPHDHPLNCRDFGVTSQRIGNYAIKNADLVICLGTRLDTHQIGRDWTKAKVVMVDVDKEELSKQHADVKIHTDLRDLEILTTHKNFSEWVEKIQALRKKYPLPKTRPYKFIKELSKYAEEGDIIITDAGQTLTWTMQAWEVKEGQRLFSAFNNSPMGYSLPASIGAQIAKPKSRVICIIGDGGLQMNLQELQTLVGYDLPIKIFVIDNQGYGMIRQTQSDWSSLKTGVACEPYFADLEKVALANEIEFVDLESEDQYPAISNILDLYGPVITRVKIPKNSKIEPKLKWGDSFEDQTPKLSKKQKEDINKAL